MRNWLLAIGIVAGVVVTSLGATLLAIHWFEAFVVGMFVVIFGVIVDVVHEEITRHWR
jgi:sorbitol-specific phosphotransferase system component IIC